MQTIVKVTESKKDLFDGVILKAISCMGNRVLLHFLYLKQCRENLSPCLLFYLQPSKEGFPAIVQPVYHQAKKNTTFWNLEFKSVSTQQINN